MNDLNVGIFNSVTGKPIPLVDFLLSSSSQKEDPIGKETDNSITVLRMAMCGK